MNPIEQYATRRTLTRWVLSALTVLILATLVFLFL